MSIGSRIKECRENLGITQEELAKAMGVSKGAIGNYEANIGYPKIENMTKLFDLLKTDANYIFQDEMKTSAQEAFTEKEIRNMIKYRTLDGYGKKAVDDILNVEYDRRITHTEALSENPICECCYTPSKHSAQFTHEEYHQRYEKAVVKFGIYYPKTAREEIRKKMDAVLATNPDLKTQIKCQNKIIKCCFSESLEHNNFDLRHCGFERYRCYILGQNKSPIPMSDVCKSAMSDKYGIHHYFEGIIHPHISPFAETPEEKSQRLLLEAFNELNEKGQSEALDYVNKLSDNGKYKPDIDDDEIE